MLINDLRAFIVVARTQSFSKAAMRLRIAQSSLSKRVTRLEKHFGVTLLNRHGRGVSLTESGVILLARGESLSFELDDIERDVRKITSEAIGIVRLAMPPATGPNLAPFVFRQCLIDHPKISLQLRENTSGAIHEWLSSGEVDLALMHNPEYGPEFEIQPLISEPLYLIAPGVDRATGLPATYPASYTINDLQHLPLILPRSPHSIRVLLERLCAGNNIQLNLLCESDSIRSTKGIVELGLGFTVFSKSTLIEEIEQGKLKAIPFTSALLSWKLCLAQSRRESQSSAIASVKRIVLSQVNVLFKKGFWPGAQLLSK
ncbi:MAG: LysR family transcriptional regulator [Burkholderiaceae bacterium]|nr:LysR family transcriptional regulator [Burkholderiaceae bacterium]